MRNPESGSRRSHANRKRPRHPDSPLARFPLLGKAGSWHVLERGRDDRFLRVYAYRPGQIGRLWLTWSRSLARFVHDSNLTQLRKHSGAELELAAFLEEIARA
jgi:hypothetical protein